VYRADTTCTIGTEIKPGRCSMTDKPRIRVKAITRFLASPHEEQTASAFPPSVSSGADAVALSESQAKATNSEYCSKVPRSVSKPDGNRTPCVLSGPQPPWICRGERRPTRLGEQQTDSVGWGRNAPLKSAVGVTAGETATNSPLADIDLSIPDFLRRDADNRAPFITQEIFDDLNRRST
jgi:hypothetical protein